MKPRLQVSRTAIELIKTFEGYRRHAARLPGGRWTIGYGHTLTAREGAEVSPDDAEALLLYDLIAVSHAVNEHVYTPLTQNQFDGLACFTFSIGVEAFRSSAVLRRVNEGNLLQAAYAMEMWRRSDFEGERIVIDALVRRRSAEKTLFLTPTDGWTPAPSPVLPPKIDFEVEPFAPRETPVAVRSPLTGDIAHAEREGAEPVAVQPEPTPYQPTASEQAAAAVSARLEALLPEQEPTAPPEPAVDASSAQEAVSEPEAAAQAPIVALAPSDNFEAVVAEEPTESEPETAPPAQAERWEAPTLAAPDPFVLTGAETPAPVHGPVDGDAAAEQERSATPSNPSLFDIAPPPAPPSGVRSRSDATFEPVFSLERAEPAGFVGVPLVALALAGLVVFAGGVFWGLNAAPDRAGGMPVIQAIGWLLGVIGVVCFGIAAYGLLRQLGGEDEGLD